MPAGGRADGRGWNSDGGGQEDFFLKTTDDAFH